ncbi:MAG TPA: hypothetical protein VHC48_12775 [Puia sp.]|nr:hypothetical protein [Puia sp.]
MFLVVCISALLKGGVQGQNFLPENVRETDFQQNITRFPEKSNICPPDNEPLVRFGKWVPERLEWRDEAPSLPAIPGMDFSHLWKTDGGGFLPARGRGKEIFRDQIMGVWSPREEMSMTRMSALLPWERAVIPADGVATHFGFFCRRELELEKTIRLPLRFRLGSLEYCNRLEGK